MKYCPIEAVSFMLPINGSALKNIHYILHDM